MSTTHKHQFVSTGTGGGIVGNGAPSLCKYLCECGERISVISNHDTNGGEYQIEGELLLKAPKK